jgi:ADP-ribose pyrophosphatase
MSKGKTQPTVIQHSVVTENPHIRIIEDDLLYQDDEKGEYIYVEKPDSCMIIALSDTNTFYMIRQFRHPAKKFFTQFPIEGMKNNESPLECAIRGLEEEVGIKAKKWKLLGSFFADPGLTTQQCFVYIAEDLEKGTLNHEPSEYIQTSILNGEDIDRLVRSNEVESWTIAAWSLYKNRQS